MKHIERDKKFTKNYTKRVSRNKSLEDRFGSRVTAFIAGERGNPLNDHALTGKKSGLRAFSISGDIRVVYQETDDAFIFLDVGTHNQVY